MFKHEIKYKDFNGEEQKETFYFNLDEGELVELELGVQGGSMTSMLSTIIQTNDGETLVKTFKRIIDLSYGQRSPDGRLFDKDPSILRAFKATGAYSVLFKDLSTNAEFASVFINQIMPGGNAATALEAAEKGKTLSETIRARSESSMQGHKKSDKSEHEGSDIQDVPAEPASRSVTADPPVELRSVTEPVPSPKVEPKEDLRKLTKAELMARLNAQN